MELLPFVGVAAVVIVTPGLDMALVGRHALLYGRRIGLAAAIGVNVGVAVWAIAAATGVAAVVRTSAGVFTTLRLLGAAYLIFVGIQVWIRSGRAKEELDLGREAPRTEEAFRHGVVSNLLNPKIGLFFTALLPQFAGQESPLVSMLILGGVFNAMGIAWLTTYAVLVARGGEILRRPRLRVAIERVTGTLLIGIGIRVALDRRPAF